MSVPRVLAAPAAPGLPWVVHDGRRVVTGRPPRGHAALVRAWSRRRIAVPAPGGALRFGTRPWIMGILNCTPDSFSDGGRLPDADAAVRAGLAMAEADFLDVGGESTRPGAADVPAAEELRRILPVVRALAEAGRFVSVDTRKAEVADAACRAGARMINDVSALGDPAMGEVAARHRVPVVLMHMRGDPRTMQRAPRYRDVVAAICDYFAERMERALSEGIRRDSILLDPGIGFGKTLEHNLGILRRLEELRSLGRPLVVGTSRKSFIGRILDRPAAERRDGTAATVAAAVLRGADVLRVHDVREMSDAARVAARLK